MSMPATMWSAWSRPRPRSKSPSCSATSKASRSEAGHGRQQFRHPLPIHQLGRKPRAGDRLRGRWHAAPHPAERIGHPGLDGKALAGQSRFVTQRQEPDTVKILSGVFEGVTTGTPIALHIDNVDQRSRDYGEIKDQFRPSHADYTYFRKYGVRDYRGGGRQSARETAVRVAAGAIARKILGDAVTIRGAVVQIG